MLKAISATGKLPGPCLLLQMD